MTYGVPLLLLMAAASLSWPLGRYLTWAMNPQTPGARRLAWDGFARRLLGDAVQRDQRWTSYGRSLLLFNFLMFALVFAITLFNWKFGSKYTND